MRQIYQSAAITLVAAVAKSASEGFLRFMEQTTYFIDPIEVPYYPENDLEREDKVILSYPADYKRWKDPINDRAWTLQEFLLSSHVIMFSYRGIEVIDRKNIPDADGLTSGKDPQLPNLPWNGHMFSLTHDAKNARGVWLAIRGEYSRRHLTYGGDKLLAIAAVAEEIGRSYGSRYLAGMWERDLARDLKWCHSDAGYGEEPDPDHPRRKPRHEEYIAPSWSWASIDGPIDDYAFDDEGENIADSLDFNVLHCEVEPAVESFEYGAIKAGVLVVSGRVHSFFWRPEKDRHMMECDGFLAVKAENEPYSEWKVGEAISDSLDPELADGCVVDCIAISLIERIPGKVEVEGLVLLPIDGERYRRVGFFKIFSPDFYNDVQPIEIRIL